MHLEAHAVSRDEPPQLVVGEPGGPVIDRQNRVSRLHPHPPSLTTSLTASRVTSFETTRRIESLHPADRRLHLPSGRTCCTPRRRRRSPTASE
jgi:hypothetical protein